MRARRSARFRWSAFPRADCCPVRRAPEVLGSHPQTRKINGLPEHFWLATRQDTSRIHQVGIMKTSRTPDHTQSSTFKAPGLVLLLVLCFAAGPAPAGT